MADQVDVMKGIARKPGVSYPVLTPNLKGFQAAVSCGAASNITFLPLHSFTVYIKNNNNNDGGWGFYVKVLSLPPTVQKYTFKVNM